MQIWAHRGTDDGVTANTISAFKKSLEYGPYGLEVDVRMCGSGEVIVFHDANLWKAAKSLLVVEDTPLERIREVVPYYVPTMKEFIEEFSSLAYLCIDVKGTLLRNNTLEKKIVEEMKGISCSRYEYSSKSVLSLAKLFNLSKGNPDTTLVIGSPRGLKMRHRLLHIRNLSVSADKIAMPTLFTGNCIRRLQRKGYDVRVYTVNTPQKAREYELMGADGIFTDKIARMKDFVG